MTPSHATGPAPAGSLAPRRRGAWARLPAAWRQRLVLLGLIGLALVPLAYVLERSAPGRLNIVYWDEFDTALRLAVKLHEGQPVGAFLQDLVAINNEHRMVTSRLLFAVLYWTTGTIDFGVVGRIGVGSLIALVVLLAVTAGTAARGVRLAVLLAFLLFQLEHYENFLWSGASIDHFTVVLLLGAAVVGLARGSTAGLVAAGVAGTAATYTLAHGLVIWPLGALLLFLTPGRRGLWPWLALSVVVVGTYFTGFKFNPSQSFVAFGPEGVLRILHYWLSILGAVPALDSQRWAPWLGAGLLGLLSYGAARGGLRRERIAVFLALGLIGATGLIAVGRAAESGGQVFSRYYVLSGTAWALALFAALERHTHPRRPWQVLAPLLPALIAFNATANREFADETDSWIECRNLAVLAYKQHGRDGKGNFSLHPHPDKVSTPLLARADQLGVYRMGAICLAEPLPRGAREVGTIQFYVDDLIVNDLALTVRGWAAATGHRATRGAVHLVLRSETATHVFSAVPASRPDVASALRQPTWKDSGFHFARRIDRLPPGTYRVGFLLDGGDRPEFTLSAHRVVIDGPRSRVVPAGTAAR